MKRFHFHMACASGALLAVAFVGCRLTSIQTNVGPRAAALGAVLAMMLPVPLYWQEKRRKAMRDAALTLPWIAVLVAVLPFPLLIAARLRMPLRDARFAHIDQALGISVPAGGMLNHAYLLLTPLLALAILLPALTGKVRVAREYIFSNLIVFALGAPLFALLPAVGPWFYYHTAPSPDQAYCQAQLFALRAPGVYLFTSQGSGIVCFPSFHAIWAVLCARALWPFRLIRFPVAVLSVAIIISTVTTGWHYFADVGAGLLLAVFAILVAKRLTQERVGSAGTSAAPAHRLDCPDIDMAS